MANNSEKNNICGKLTFFIRSWLIFIYIFFFEWLILGRTGIFHKKLVNPELQAEMQKSDAT